MSREADGTQITRTMVALREKITRGEIAPGERVTEVELAEQLQVSRTPVREAIRRLAGEGLLEYVPNFGTVVPRWSDSDVQEVFDVRALLEGYAASLAAERASAIDISELREMCTGMRAIEGDDAENRWDDYALRNNAFHRQLFVIAGNGRLEGMLIGLLGIALLHRAFPGHTATAMCRSNNHHDEIVDAIEAGDAGWAQAMMRAHIHSTRILLLGQFGGEHPVEKTT